MLTKKGEVPSRFQLGSLKNKLNFTETLVKLIKEYLPASPLTPSSKEKLFTVENQFVFIRKQINKNDFSQNELIDINNEISRLNRMFQLKLLSETYFDRYNQEIKRKVDFISSLVHSLKSYTALDNEVKNNISELQKLIPRHVKITELERKEIINAMEMKKGHWFKCSNNHIYAIAECGGAMEVGKCPECGVPIGGTNHALLSSNSLASEMDGATYAAYSEIANNLNNFHL